MAAAEYTKQCTKCLEYRFESEFRPQRRVCKPCARLFDQERYQENAEEIRRKKRIYMRNRRAIDPLIALEKEREYRQKNPGQRVSPDYFRKVYESLPQSEKDARIEKLKIWKKQNPDRRAANESRRRARKFNASPKWAKESRISEMFVLARDLTEKTGIKHQVDHIIPLRSTLVCGLHVETNLQVITAVENIKKLNRFWPDMP